MPSARNLTACAVPVFYVEVLADLEKQGRHGKPPESTVGRLAEKTPSNAYPNVDHGQIVLRELTGQQIEMTHRPVIRAGDVKRRLISNCFNSSRE